MDSTLDQVVVVFVLLLATSGASEPIDSLPDQPKVQFQQHSGYIPVDETQDRALFYYLVEAESDPDSKSLVLWLHGGPGCSSVGIGAFLEHGPSKPRGHVLVINDYRWNKEANMLYLDSPAGVGFSYSANPSFYTSVDGNMTAQDNFAFLLRWFEKFPEFKSRDFFIAGESYAGHFVPQLAQLILKSKAKINLKGIAIGNPLLDFNSDFNSEADFYYSHGLIPEDTYFLLNNACNLSTIHRETVQTGTLTPACCRVMSLVSSNIGVVVELFDIIMDVCRASTKSDGVDVCGELNTYEYMNRTDVQKALHGKLVGVSVWTPCSSVLMYSVQDLEVPIVHLLGSLVKSGIRVLVYSGDQDAVIPLISTRKLVHGLARDLGLNTTVPCSPWFVHEQFSN